MNRREAIDAIMSTWAQRDQEFVVSQDEGEASDRELHEALHALGVTDVEIDGGHPTHDYIDYYPKTPQDADRLALEQCRQIGHDMHGSDRREPEGRQQCARCGTIKEWDREGAVTFTYPEVQS